MDKKKKQTDFIDIPQNDFFLHRPTTSEHVLANLFCSSNDTFVQWSGCLNWSKQQITGCCSDLDSILDQNFISMLGGRGVADDMSLFTKCMQ